MKYIHIILALISFSIMAQQSSAQELLKLNRDTLIEKAVTALREQLPDIVTPEKGFDVNNFERISLRSCDDQQLSITFEYIFKYIHDTTIARIYNINVDLLQHSASYEILPSSLHTDKNEALFYIPDENSNSAFLKIMNAYKKINAPQPDSQFYKMMLNDSSWEVVNKKDHYDIHTDSEHTVGWSKVNKETLEIFDDRHKHYDLSGKESCYEEVIRERYSIPVAKPSSVFFIEDKPVSKNEFDKFLATLKENPNTWFCAETNKGGRTGYDASDIEGVVYEVRFISEEGATGSIRRK
jgi:hypothetical protein